ncbi:glycosyltransferase [Butyrivibrio sp. WCE2006]|uniref:glycosyltransferase n=1 Tax=Butyrivibrio sp. WCE2006 TaxID=1410611 RepID=UPI0006791BF7|nr:glycosyltransferase [Butyrivibrio sp. WCE2006]
MDELISVIVPVYKVENYIRKCIDSIIAQTYTTLEIILVDDGSPDNCGFICDEYAENDKRIRVIHKENGGLSSARNAALDVMSGAWIICVDSDDYVHPDMVRRLHDAATENNAEISMCSHYIEKADKLLITERVEDDIQVLDKKTALYKLIEDKEIKNYAWGKLYKSELFDGVRYPEGRNYEDIATTYYLFDKAKKIVKLPDYLYYYLIREDGISFNNSAAAWHKGCHATCLGQEERAAYFLQKGYDDLYELAMAKLLPYLYSDIRSGYIVQYDDNINDTKSYLKEHMQEFITNSMISDKDKQIISIYLKDEFAFNVYNSCKSVYKKCIKNIYKLKRIIKPDNSSFDFSIANGKLKRIVYFELPCFDNLGDHAIAYVTEYILNNICLKEAYNYQLFVVDGWETDQAIKSLKKCITPDDVVICQGGGNFGSLYEFAEIFRRKVLKAFKNNKIIIMPQTLYYLDDEKGSRELLLDQKAVRKCKQMTIFARDAVSYKLMKQYFPADIILLHDTVSLFDATYLASTEREGIVICLRSDKESALKAEDKIKIIEFSEANAKKIIVTDTCTNYEVSRAERKRILEKKISLFGGAKLVITDRLHGMIFSVITGTPCIVLGNDHHKVFETYKTFSDCSYIKYVNSIDELKLLYKSLSRNNADDKKINLADDLKILEDKIVN